jgi:hypothetical protein
MENYDSTEDTKKHIQRVQKLMSGIILMLANRHKNHDKSKLEEPEKSIFDEYTPKLRDTTYGSPEYKVFLSEMGVGLKHHYKNNSHHPEHFDNGVNGMTLVDLIEMFCDWKAATERHADGDLGKSIEINKKRFKMTDQLVEIFKNTKAEMGW